MPQMNAGAFINAVGSAVMRASKKDTVAIKTVDGPEVAHAVETELRKDPVVASALNLEPWYQSRVTWGSILAIASGIAGALGYVIDAVDIQQITTIAVAVASAIGGLFALYGRWVAKKPLGE